MTTFIDEEKALDWIKWNFLKYTLKKVALGPAFLQWTDLLYKKQITRIIYAGHKSKMANMQRGVYQSCKLCLLLFDLVIEMLAIAVRAETDILGVLINSIEHKVILYVDDVGREVVSTN